MNYNKQTKENERSPLAKVVGIAGVVLALDGVIVPFFTGQTIHEYLGLPPGSDYKVLGETTALKAEQALWGITTLFQVGIEYYNKK